MIAQVTDLATSENANVWTAMKDTTVQKVSVQFFVRGTVRMQVVYVTVWKGGKVRNVTFQHTTVSRPTVPGEVNVSPAIAIVRLDGKGRSATKRTALIQPAVAMAHACEVDACVVRDGEVPPAVNVMLGYNVVSLHVPNVAYTTWMQEDVCVTLSTPEMIARKWCVHWIVDRMVFVPRAFVAAMTAGQAPCVTNDLVTRAVTTTANAKTARASVHKGGMAGTVLCLVVQMAVLVMDNVFWKMECTGVPAPTAGLALTAPSHLNFLATTTRITMKMA